MKQAKCITKIKQLIKEQHPEINLVDFGIPLTNGLPTPKLKDILETNVDEKYYLKNSVVEKIVNESNFQERLVSLKLSKPSTKASAVSMSGPVNLDDAGRILKQLEKKNKK